MPDARDHNGHGRLEELLASALALPEAERRAFLDGKCVGDHDLRNEVESLLRFQERGDTFLGRPVGALAGATRFAEQLLERPPPEPRAGDELDQYVVLSQLGEGGMGTVFLARQATPVRREVALKVLKTGTGGGEARARFALECAALARMDHPNIARILGAGATADGRPYYAMELVPGMPLARYCDERRLTVEERIELLLQVCAGVQHAHEAGILHRDLKPSNVLVREQDGRPVAKIIDFGVAKALAGELDGATLHTFAGALIGTPDYMSPEQASTDGRAIDARTDVYSLGTILYELLAGRLPLELRRRSGLTCHEMLTAILSEDPPAPSRAFARLGDERARVAERRAATPIALARRLRGDLDGIALRALERDLARRYRSVADLAADLRRHLAHEPVLATPPGALYRMRKFARRNRLWLGVIAVLLFALIGMAALAIEAARARRRADENLAFARPFADYGSLIALREEADRLWPPRVVLLPALDSWLARAGELTTRREEHAASLGAHGTDRTLTTELVAGLQGLMDPCNPRSIPRVEARRRLAATIEEMALVAGAELWQRAIASIADPEECPAYQGLRIRPQSDLVPLARDPRSGLWEFLHLQSGTAPSRTADGRVLPGEEMGIVLVLLPGGSFRMGSEQGPPERHGEPNLDQHARPDEAPVQTVHLDPFFVSKYELTRGQWQRLDGPAELLVDRSWGAGDEPLFPMHRITQQEAAETLAKGNLELPTEAQWEYAARAGTTTPFCTGIQTASLSGHANLSDLCTNTRYPDWQYERFDDCFERMAPVGFYEPNRFGLHDVHGNVWEWAQDPYLDYRRPVAAADGLRLASEEERRVLAKVCRGGAWDGAGPTARVARRFNTEAYLRPSAGARAARQLEP